MDDTPATTEQDGTVRRVSKHPETDRDIREQRRDLIATLLLSRVPYRKMVQPIRDTLGITVSVGTIASDVAVIRQRWQARMAASYGEHVAEQMAYYDGLLRAVAPKAFAGDHHAVQDAMGLLDRRARLIGMDQPDKVLALVGVGMQHTEDVAAKWASAPREEQLARTEQIAAILIEADALRLPGGPPLQNAAVDVIDIPATNGEDHA